MLKLHFFCKNVFRATAAQLTLSCMRIANDAHDFAAYVVL